ncbi:MAG TPA: RNA polymerase factor sigma-54 [Blastocatellia bacterium]|nr:RNA polymerase factor sigma-54 [Blastocatellia bacterium]
MSFKQGLSQSLRQNLGLVLTPQLRQRIEMLQMTKLELNDLVNQQLQENPVLEELSPEEISVAPSLGGTDFAEDAPVSVLNDLNDYGSGSETSSYVNGATEAGEFAGSEAREFAGDSSFDSYADERAAATTTATTTSDVSEGEVGERDSFEEIDFGQTFEEYLDPGYRTRETEIKEGPTFEQFLSSEQSLGEYLEWQLRMTQTPDDVREAAEAIIGNLNDDGYLEGTREEIAALGGWSMDTVNAAFDIIAQFDPPGVGACTLQECLVMQLQAMGYGDRLAVVLIRQHFHKLQNHKLPELARELNISLEDLLNELKVIRQLEPHPGRKFAPSQAQYVEPEVYIEKMDDDYVIRFNDDGLPQLRINSQYRRMMENKDTSKETRDYIKDRFRSAVDLLKNIEHRKQTIYRVCEQIVYRQRDFLDKGVEYIKPMMLKDISEDIGMHLSTVSRVVNGKYAHTPQGVIELRRFFTEGMTNEDGEEVSTQIIKLKIKKMIEAEDAKNPLTDDEIAKILAQEGQKLSRRTVAKYRDQLRIPGSRERRQVI